MADKTIMMFQAQAISTLVSCATCTYHDPKNENKPCNHPDHKFDDDGSAVISHDNNRLFCRDWKIDESEETSIVESAYRAAIGVYDN